MENNFYTKLFQVIVSFVLHWTSLTSLATEYWLTDLSFKRLLVFIKFLLVDMSHFSIYQNDFC